MAEKIKLDPKVTKAVPYVPLIGWIAAVVLLIVEKDEKVRFHAVQGLLVAGVLFLLKVSMGLTIILLFLVPLIWVGGIILQLYLVYQVYNGREVRLPYLSEWTEMVLEKLSG